MINFKEEVLKRKEEIVSKLQELVRIPSELTSFDPKRVHAPFGKPIQESLEWFIDLAHKDGFVTENLDGYAGHIILGDQKTFVGSIGHLDVVPAGNGWTHDPYGAEIADGLMFGRGTSDDKGPTIAVYYAMKILKDLNLPLKHSIKLILGTDEETAWRCVDYYFEKYPQAPVSGFIPDADFPLIYAEKGISRIQLYATLKDSDMISFNGGFRDNMVPDFATVTLNDRKNYGELFKTYQNKHTITGSVKTVGNTYIIEVSGKSAHGSLPHEGVNAIDILMGFLIEHEESPFTKLYRDTVFDDLYGKKMNIYHQDDEMGPTTANLGVMTIESGNVTMFLNYRYPHGIVFSEVVEKIKAFYPTANADHHKALLYNDPNSPLIQTLLDVYQTHTKDYKSKPFSIGGGTFARAMPNVVAYGAHFLGTPSYIHQPEEFINIEELLLATAIYAEALYRLANDETVS